MIELYMGAANLIHEGVVIVPGSHYLPNTATDQPRYTGIQLPLANRNVTLMVAEDVCLGCDRMECICDRERD